MWETCFLRFLWDTSAVHSANSDFTSNNRNIFALLQNCIIKLICFILILISVSTSLFHDFKATIFVFKNHNRITVPDLCGIIMFVPEIILAVDRSTKGLAFETHANAFRCILNLAFETGFKQFETGFKRVSNINAFETL